MMSQDRSAGKAPLLCNPYGEVLYETFRDPGRAFVDKSAAIKALDEGPRYPILLRPQRFGKTAFIQMLKCFYDLSYKDRYEELFSDTDIYKENLLSHNTFHVINFDFSMVNMQSVSAMLNSFFSAVASGIDDFMVRYPDFAFSYSDLDKSDAVTLFNYFASAYSEYAYDCFIKDRHVSARHDYGAAGRLYVMIDEYDSFARRTLVPDLELYRTQTGGFGFIKAFYAAIKAAAADADCIAKIFITGVSSMSLDSIASGFNIALNVTSDACFNEYAGFTEAELAKLIPHLVDIKQLGFSTEEIIALMKTVYGGYCFSQEAERTVFNSSMCLYCLDEMRIKGRVLPPEDYLIPALDRDGIKLKRLLETAEDGNYRCISERRQVFAEEITQGMAFKSLTYPMKEGVRPW